MKTKIVAILILTFVLIGCIRVYKYEPIIIAYPGSCIITIVDITAEVPKDIDVNAEAEMEVPLL